MSRHCAAAHRSRCPSGGFSALLLALLLAGCAVPPAGPGRLPGSVPSLPAPPSAPPATPVGAIEADTHEQINRHRTQRGLPALGFDTRIAAVARRHSEEMASGRRPFGHDGFDARAAEIRSAVAMRSMAENVAYNPHAAPARITVQDWLSSPGHLRNVENRAFNLTGIGVARSPDGTYYFTQIFVAVP